MEHGNLRKIFLCYKLQGSVTVQIKLINCKEHPTRRLIDEYSKGMSTLKFLSSVDTQPEGVPLMDAVVSRCNN